MKILIAGTHFTPAHAVISKLKEFPDTKITYVGRKSTREGDKTPSIESQILPKLGVKFIPIIAGRLQKALTIYTIPSLFKIPIGFMQAFLILLKERPDVVLSFGGYVALPVVVSAWFLSIPIITHEQTLVSGLTSSISAIFANKIAVSFSEGRDFQNGKIVLTGNPMRDELLNPTVSSKEIAEFVKNCRTTKLPLILITGGNQGSHVINQAVIEVLPELCKIACVVHQTGDSKYNDFEHLVEAENNLTEKNKYLPKKWLDASDFGYIMKNADFVIARAGINTLLESAYFTVPLLLIPIPYLSRNEQVVNARYFEKMEAARVIYQNNLSGKNLLIQVGGMIENLVALKKGAVIAQKIVITDAAQRIALETELLARKK